MNVAQLLVERDILKNELSERIRDFRPIGKGLTKASEFSIKVKKENDILMKKIKQLDDVLNTLALSDANTYIVFEGRDISIAVALKSLEAADEYPMMCFPQVPGVKKSDDYLFNMYKKLSSILEYGDYEVGYDDDDQFTDGQNINKITDPLGLKDKAETYSNMVNSYAIRLKALIRESNERTEV